MSLPERNSNSSSETSWVDSCRVESSWLETNKHMRLPANLRWRQGIHKQLWVLMMKTDMHHPISTLKEQALSSIWNNKRFRFIAGAEDADAGNCYNVYACYCSHVAEEIAFLFISAFSFALKQCLASSLKALHTFRHCVAFNLQMLNVAIWRHCCCDSVEELIKNNGNINVALLAINISR